MKHFLKSCLAVGVALIGFAATAQVPVAPKTYSLTNTTTLTAAGSAIITAGASSNYSTVPFPIWRDRSFNLHLAVYTSGPSGSNVEATIQFGNYHTFAGVVITNWDNQIVFDFPNTGATEKILSTNVPKVIVDNYAIGRLLSVTNGGTTTLSVDPTNSYVAAIP